MARRRRTKAANPTLAPLALTGAMAEMATLAFTAPFVIATRTAGMWAHTLSPTPSGDRENLRMVAEKMTAGAESIAAANAAVAKQAISAGAAAMAGRRPPGMDVEAVVTASLKPYTKRVKANARRLSRKR